jgi:hypothetical protein
MYDVLINRILSGNGEVQRIFQLGGRKAVIEACRADQATDGRPRLYIIDGDFDIICGKPKIELNHLHRLSVYCSENLVITENALYEVAFESATNKTREQIKTEFNFTDLLQTIDTNLRSLFVYYAVAHTLSPELPTVSFNVTRMLDMKSKPKKFSQSQLKERIRSIRDKLVAIHGEAKIDAALGEVHDRMPKQPEEFIRVISGKTYVLPLIYHFIRDVYNYRGTLDQLKVKLARHCELDVDKDLKDAVINASIGIAA